MIRKNLIKLILIIFHGLTIARSLKKSGKIVPENLTHIETESYDVKYIRTHELVQYMLRNAQFLIAFNINVSKTKIEKWQVQVRVNMQELMQFPG